MDELWRMSREVIERFPDYGSEGCICGNVATPDPACPLHFPIAEMERMEDETWRALSAARNQSQVRP